MVLDDMMSELPPDVEEYVVQFATRHGWDKKMVLDLVGTVTRLERQRSQQLFRELAFHRDGVKLGTSLYPEPEP